MSDTDALVLRRIPYGDTSLVVHLLTADRGRVAALAKGTFRPTSPHFGALDLLNRIQARVLRRREEGLALLGETVLVDAHRRLRTRAESLAAAFYASELLDAASTEAPAPGLFALAVAWLETLDGPTALEGNELSVALAGFELRFLDELGLRPVLERCAECGRELGSERLGCSASSGGAVCGRCAATSRDAVAVSALTLAAGRALLSGAAPPRMRREELRELRAWLDRFHAYHLDRVPRSRPSLERIRFRR